MLTNADAVAELSKRRTQSLDQVLRSYRPGTRLTPLEILAMREISSRFRLRTIHRGEQGYLVVRLERR